LALALGGGAQAQVSLGDLHASANGELQMFYTDSYGNIQGTDNHSLAGGGKGVINGNYYNPDFLSFSILPYYGRSQNNSELQSVTDASGYTGLLNIFKGGHFPGFVTFDQNWNQTGNFGIPGVTGLNTRDNGHGIGLGWSALLPGLPTLSVGFSDTGGSSALLGSSSSTDTSVRNFNVGTTYNFHRYFLSGGFLHLTDNVELNGVEDLLTGEPLTETAHGSSDQYRFMVQGPVPYRTSSLSFSANRITYSDDDSVGGINNGTTDTILGSLNLTFPKAPVTVTTNYTDNVVGSIEQQLVSSGQVPLTSFGTPIARSLDVEGSTFVSVLPRLTLGGYVGRTQQYIDGESFGLTRVGGTIDYNFLHKLKGLTLYGGVFDNATQQGNNGLGVLANATYNRYVGKWELNGFFDYTQGTQTLLVMYTTSTLNYGGTVRRQITPRMRWAAIANVLHSGFEQVSGDNSRGESFTTILGWDKVSISGTYSKSNGTAILTATGLVTTPIPTQLLGPGASILYAGESYGGNLGLYPWKRMIVRVSWSRALANSSGPLTLSNSGFTNYYGFAGYEYRKLLFQAGYTRFNQAIFNSGMPMQPPSMLTSFSFGVSRWFKGF
jgi:hypothetical protein